MTYYPVRNKVQENGKVTFKLPILTTKTYLRFLKRQGAGEVIQLFLDICREKGNEFRGFKVEDDYVYAFLSNA